MSGPDDSADPAGAAGGSRLNPTELRLLAERLARAAGSQALAGRRRLGIGQHVTHDTKSTSTDPVTESIAPPKR